MDTTSDDNVNIISLIVIRGYSQKLEMFYFSFYKYFFSELKTKKQRLSKNSDKKAASKKIRVYQRGQQ